MQHEKYETPSKKPRKKIKLKQNKIKATRPEKSELKKSPLDHSVNPQLNQISGEESSRATDTSKPLFKARPQKSKVVNKPKQSNLLRGGERSLKKGVKMRGERVSFFNSENRDKRLVGFLNRPKPKAGENVKSSPMSHSDQTDSSSTSSSTAALWQSSGVSSSSSSLEKDVLNSLAALSMQLLAPLSEEILPITIMTPTVSAEQSSPALPSTLKSKSEDSIGSESEEDDEEEEVGDRRIGQQKLVSFGVKPSLEQRQKDERMRKEKLLEERALIQHLTMLSVSRDSGGSAVPASSLQDFPMSGLPPSPPSVSPLRLVIPPRLSLRSQQLPSNYRRLRLVPSLRDEHKTSGQPSRSTFLPPPLSSTLPSQSPLSSVAKEQIPQTSLSRKGKG